MVTTTVIDILDALESDNSRLFKEDVLERNKSNKLLRRVFVAASDPYVHFYVNKVKMPSPVKGAAFDPDGTVESFLDFLYDWLSTRKVVGNAAKDMVVSNFAKMTVVEQKWCMRILLRNLRVGVMETTINKVWPGAISKFSVALAKQLKSHFDPGKGIVVDEPVTFPVRVEPKLDGLRCVAIKHNGIVTMYTRSGHVIDTLPSIKADLESAPYDDVVLDAESIGADWNESASVMMSKKNSKDDGNMRYNVFDAVPYDEWIDQESKSPLSARVVLAKKIVSDVNSPRVVSVDGKTVNTPEEMMAFYSEVMSKGYEGIMLKKLTSPYIFDRSTALLKLKPVTTFEAMIVSHYEGKRGSKREGLWGGFEVLLPNGVVTKVGGGYSDKLKAEIGLDPDSWIGKVVEVEGQPDPLTSDGLTSDGRIRFPVFVRVRDVHDVDQKVLKAYKNRQEKNDH